MKKVNENNKEKEKFLEEITTKIQAKLNEIKKLKGKLKARNKEVEQLKTELKSQTNKNATDKQYLENTIQNLNQILASKEREAQKLIRKVQEGNEILNKLKNLLESTPSFYGSFLRAHLDGTIDVLYEGRRMRINAVREIDVKKLKAGQKLRIIQFQNSIIVVMALDNDYQLDTGEQAIIKGFLDNNRIIVDHRTDQKVLILAEPLLKIKKELEIGDKILFDYNTGFAFAKLPKSEVEQIELETIPNVTWADIGGLDEQIEKIREEIEFPFLYPEEYKAHKSDLPKGVMLFGPPGNGKTMLGKALANHLEQEFAQKLGKKQRTGNFLLINGPELSSKWVGETERFIRELFDKARRKYKETGIPVVMFFDEVDSFLPTRGSRPFSGATDDYVTQFCVEVSGVEELEGIIVVLATNRIDKVDPAVLRPGRVDFKIRIGQPNEKGARSVLSKYLTPDLPFHSKYKSEEYKFKDASEIANYLIKKVIERIYSQKPEIQAKNRYVELTLKDGKTEILYFKDFVSCAALKNIVDRAKKKSIKNVIEGGERGIRLKMLYKSIEEEFQENEGLPSSREAIDEWLRMHGKRWEIIGEPKFLTRETEKSKETKDKSPDIL